jgi:glycosyltransferase A (GT-A) superfamily protein (DUF2064 family)
LLQTVAILIFAREVSEESSRKLLVAKNRQANKRIFQNLNILTNQKSHATQIPVFVSSQLDLDSKATFGQNISRAISCVFEKGFEKVICIGNDCPALQKEHLIATAEALNTTDAVIGPDFRGGTYLIGLSKKVFDTNSFQNLPWQTSELLEHLVMSFCGKRIQILDQLSDINSFQDLYFYPTARHIISFLLKFIDNLSFCQFSLGFSKKNEFFLNCLSFRGPPILGF